MQVDHGGFDVGMTEIFLDDAEVDPSFQQVSSVSGAQGEDGYAFLFNAGGVFCFS